MSLYFFASNIERAANLASFVEGGGVAALLFLSALLFVALVVVICMLASAKHTVAELRGINSALREAVFESNQKRFKDSRELEELRMAIGLLTTLKGDLIMDGNNPLAMAKELELFIRPQLRRQDNKPFGTG